MTMDKKEVNKLLKEIREVLKPMDNDPDARFTHVFSYKGMRFAMSLNPQKPGAKYLYRGTVKGLDQTSGTLKLEGGYARHSICVSRPSAGSISEDAAEKVCKAMQDEEYAQPAG